MTKKQIAALAVDMCGDPRHTPLKDIYGPGRHVHECPGCGCKTSFVNRAAREGGDV